MAHSSPSAAAGGPADRTTNSTRFPTDRRRAAIWPTGFPWYVGFKRRLNWLGEVPRAAIRARLLSSVSSRALLHSKGQAVQDELLQDVRVLVVPEDRIQVDGVRVEASRTDVRLRLCRDGSLLKRFR